MTTSVGFETSGDWTISQESGVDCYISPDNVRDGSYALVVDPNTAGAEDGDGYGTYDGSDLKYAEGTIYYNPANGASFNTAFIVREQSAGGSALAIVYDGDLKIVEGSVGSWSTLTTNTNPPSSINSGTWTQQFKFRLKSGSSQDCYAELEIDDGTVYTTSEVSPSVSSSGRVGFGQVSVGNVGRPNYWDTGSFTDLTISPPSQPQNTQQAVIADDKIDVTWNAPSDWGSGTGYYTLEVSEDGGAWTQVASGLRSTSHTYSATTSSNTHDFRVKACNSAGCSAWSGTNAVSTDPTALSVTAHDDVSVSLSWTGARDADGYEVLSAEASGSIVSDYSQAGTTAAGTTTFTHSSLENGEQYYYRVRALYDGGTDSQLTAEVNQITNLPAAVLSLDATVEDEITVSWTKQDNSPDGEWELYRSTDGSLGSLIADALALTTAEYVDTGLADGEQYYYTLRRITDHATTDSQQNGITILPAPTSLAVSNITSDAVDLSWVDNADNEDGYRVYVSRDQGETWTNISGGLPSNTESYQATNLLNGERYLVNVEVYTAYAARRSV